MLHSRLCALPYTTFNVDWLLNIIKSALYSKHEYGVCIKVVLQLSQFYYFVYFENNLG